MLSDIDQFDRKENQQVLISWNLMPNAQSDQNAIVQVLQRFENCARQIQIGNFPNGTPILLQ